MQTLFLSVVLLHVVMGKSDVETTSCGSESNQEKSFSFKFGMEFSGFEQNKMEQFCFCQSLFFKFGTDTKVIGSELNGGIA
jgi:hypothetical protein